MASVYETAQEALETEAQSIYANHSEHGIQLSMAISLKRIADTLDKKNKEEIIREYLKDSIDIDDLPFGS